MKRELPSRPSLDQLKIQAKELVKSCKSQEPEAIRRIREAHPRWSNATGRDIAKAKLKLSDAQLVIAREYGFESWPKLKHHVQKLELENRDPIELFSNALKNDDAALMQQLFERFPEFKGKINEPVADFDAPVVTCVRSKKMLDVLLAAGANINARSRWWAGGFGLLDSAEPELARYAIQRGATVDVHAAARLGMLERLRELITASPHLVHARGGDGQTPLHFASTVEIAKVLLDHGADIDARDVDHESTAAQYMVRDRQEIARYLVERGCHTDILMAAALGDPALVRKHLDADPECVRMRVSHEFFPMVGGKAGGTIYQWTLGWYVSAHQVAKDFAHQDIYQLLMENSPPDVQFINALWLNDSERVASLHQADPAIASKLTEADRRQVAHAARNNDIGAVARMLAAGLPVNAQGQHRATPLHWAAWHGNVGMVRTILRYNPPIENADNEFSGTPMRWAIHGSENGWHRTTGDYAGTVEALIAAGAKLPDKPGGSEPVQTVLQRAGVRS